MVAVRPGAEHREALQLGVYDVANVIERAKNFKRTHCSDRSVTAEIHSLPSEFVCAEALGVICSNAKGVFLQPQRHNDRVRRIEQSQHRDHRATLDGDVEKIRLLLQPAKLLWHEEVARR